MNFPHPLVGYTSTVECPKTFSQFLIRSICWVDFKALRQKKRPTTSAVSSRTDLLSLKETASLYTVYSFRSVGKYKDFYVFSAESRSIGAIYFCYISNSYRKYSSWACYLQLFPLYLMIHIWILVIHKKVFPN